MLVADQRALAREIEQTFVAYDARLRDLATRVHELTPEEFQREAKTIRDAQDGLRRALRRLEVSSKNAADLQRELALWEKRVDDSSLYADHPAFRTEIIQSELRSRGATIDTRAARQNKEVVQGMGSISTTTPSAGSPDAQSSLKNPLLWLTHEKDVVADASLDEDSDEGLRVESLQKSLEGLHEPITMPEVEYLLQAIREATRETERWHGVPESSWDEEALIQVHHLRDLHALLKRLDRERGVSRDRLELAVAPRAFH